MATSPSKEVKTPQHDGTPRARIQVIYGLLEFVADRIEIPENVREFTN